MDHSIMGPFWGNVAIIVVAGGITAACIAAMTRMLFRPGERDPRHPKYTVLEDGRQVGG